MKERIARAYPYLLLAAALLPLVVIDWLMYPAVAGKTLLFRGLGVITLAAFAYLALMGQAFYWQRLRHWHVWIPAALCIVAFITSLLGTDFYRSFWSTFNRGDGLLTLLVAVEFFYLILLYADAVFIARFIKVVAWVGSVVALVVTLQWLQGLFGVDLPLVPVPDGRIGGTFGNAAFAAGYLGMTIFVTVMARGEASGKWRRFFAWAIALQVVAIILTATRGTILALFITALAWLTFTAFRGNDVVKKSARIALVSTVVITLLFAGFRSSLATIPFEPIARLATISLSDRTVASRLFVWQGVGSEALQHPLTGVGAEHIEIIFNRIYDPSKISEEWFDRSHNAFLDYFAQHGLFGLLLYIALIALALTFALRLLKRGEAHSAPLLALFGVYAVQNLVVFDTAMTLFLLTTLIASALVLERAPEKPTALSRRTTLASIIGVVLLVPLWPIAFEPLLANAYLAYGYRYHVTDVGRANEWFMRGLSFNTYADLEYAYRAYDMYTSHQEPALKGDALVAAYGFARDTLATAAKHYPYDARVATYYGHVLDTAPDGVAVDETEAREVLARAIALSPKRAQAYYILANISLRKGDALLPGVAKRAAYLEAIGVVEGYRTLVPRDAEPSFILASLALAAGESREAARYAEAGLTLYAPGATIARKALKYYLAIEDVPHIRGFLEDIVAGEPENDTARYDLAKAHYLLGNRAEALRLTKELRARNPAMLETDQAFLAAITAYEQSL